MKNIQQLKKELAAAGLSVVVTAVALSSATYAWFVTNNKVEGTTSTISATTNGFILQIGELSKVHSMVENRNLWKQLPKEQL